MPSCLPGERLGRDRCSLEGGARTHDALQRGLVAHQERDLREQPQGWREAEMTPAERRTLVLIAVALVAGLVAAYLTAGLLPSASR